MNVLVDHLYADLGQLSNKFFYFVQAAERVAVSALLGYWHAGKAAAA